MRVISQFTVPIIFSAARIRQDTASFRNADGEVSGDEGVYVTAGQVYLDDLPVQVVLCGGIGHTEMLIL